MSRNDSQVRTPVAGEEASGTSMGDSTAAPTPAASEAKTPSVPQAGDTFPWEFRCEVPDADGMMVETAVPCTATITSVSRDLVWCAIEPTVTLEPRELAALRRAVGFPRHIHVMMASARKALGLPAA